MLFDVAARDGNAVRCGSQGRRCCSMWEPGMLFDVAAREEDAVRSGSQRPTADMLESQLANHNKERLSHLSVGAPPT